MKEMSNFEAGLDQILAEEFDMRREPFGKKDWTGNGIRRMLKGADKLEEVCQSNEGKKFARALAKIGKIQNFTEVNLNSIFIQF